MEVTEPTGQDHGVAWMLSCSLDLLIPILVFDESHYEFLQTVTGWQKLYFYFHQCAGYLLASLLIVGLAGLTQEGSDRIRR